MVKQKFNFIKNAYTTKRGTPAMLEISCANCNQYIMSYQKDGPGPLLRCYLDRIHHPGILEKKQYSCLDKNSMENLICSNCGALIGSPMVYEKENRLAFQMTKGTFSKKIVKKPNLLQVNQENDCK